MYKYKFIHRIKFILTYYLYKLLVPIEVTSPKRNMFFFELMYALNNTSNVLLGRRKTLVYPYNDGFIDSKFGKFKIRPKTMDAAIASPAFERLDVNFLCRILKKESHSNRQVLFCDIGGDIGTYSVIVGNLPSSKLVDIVCFEPVPESCEIIRENLQLNCLQNRVRLYNVALGASKSSSFIYHDPHSPGSSSIQQNVVNVSDTSKVRIQIETLDDVLGSSFEKYDTIVFKLDVEGFETQVFKGSQRILRSKKKIWILVEDFVDISVVDYLENVLGAKFETKITDYNSWWSIN